jgi:hypothetical protein
LIPLERGKEEALGDHRRECSRAKGCSGGGASLAEALGVIKKKETERNTSLF